MNNFKLFFIFLFFVSINSNVNSHNKKQLESSQDAGINLRQDSIKVWLSTADETKKLTRESDMNFILDKGGDPAYTITVNDELTYQKWIGCGSTTNDASSWLMFKKLKKEAKDELMNNLFSKSTGIGLDWVRHQMGSGDAAVINGGWWTYDDMPKGQADIELKNFSIDLERDYILPTLKQALRINPKLKIIGCPWTPPGWMKTSSDDPNPLNHGYIKPQYYTAFANYFVKFIQEYKKEGIPVYGISLQNEPLANAQRWQACGIPAEVARNLIKNYFVPVFKKNSITSKIYVFDHNWNNGWDYISTLYNDSMVYNAVAGSMWHHYRGLPSIMTDVHNAYPEKEIWFSEGAATIRNPNPSIYVSFDTYSGSFLNFSFNTIHVSRNWCQTMMMYQIALDPAHGPAVFAPPTNYAMVTIDPKDGSIIYRPEYYVLGHISKFVYPNASRIESNQYEGDIESVAFKNPDGSIILILSNRYNMAKNIKVKWGKYSFNYNIPRESMITFKW